METRKIRVAIPHGDTNGIGYELIFRTFADQEMLDMCVPIVYGSPKVATYHRKALGVQTNFNVIEDARNASEGCINILTCFDEEVKVGFGTPTPESGAAALKAMDKALADYNEGLFDALVICPTDDRAIRESVPEFAGMRQRIESCVNGGKSSLALWLNSSLRIGSVAQGKDMRDVAQEITRANIERKAICLYESLRRDFLLSGSRIAILSLNSMAGDEERNEITPAVEELSGSIIGVFGPYTPARFFGEREYQEFDAVLAMYDDQAAVPFETLSCDTGCRFLAGLPLVCTAMSANPHFELAGKGQADISSFRKAIYAAIDIAANRRRYDAANAHPLGKLYHEKREEADKQRASASQKRENAQKDRAQA